MKNTVISALVAFVLLPAFVQAEEVATVPEGYVTVTIAGSINGTAYNQTPFSAPLLSSEGVLGQTSGRITAVTSNTISNGNAGWTSSALATTGLPYFINITSGVNAGRMFQITANTTTQLTINSQGLDLTTLSFAVGSAGDTYEIVKGDTLLGILGTPSEGVIGGTSSQFSANTVDKVLVNDSAGNALSCYFDTAANQWRRLGSGANQGNLVVSPKSGLVYSRISLTPLALTFIGKVPATMSKHQIPATGTTILSSFFPTDTTITGLNLHNMLGWRSVGGSITTSNCDSLIVKNGLTTISYYYDSTVSQWKRLGSGANQGSVVVPAGSSVRLVRSGTAGQSHTWSRDLPYVAN